MSASLLFAAAVIATRGYTLAPSGFYNFCLASPKECSVADGRGKAPFTYLDEVNRAVNAFIKPEAERGGADVWKIGGNTGDCEDYALTKRSILIKAGLSSSAARIAVGTTRSGEKHAVLIVDTATGQVVLDNRSDKIHPIGASGLRFDEIQSAVNPRIWLKVQN